MSVGVRKLDLQRNYGIENGFYGHTALSIGENMPSVELVTVERGLRGKGNEGKKVQFQAISETAPRPDNPLDAALQLVNGDLQEFWERYVLGYNEYSYSSVADPIAAFLDASWDADKTKNFRNSVNALSKTLGMEKEEVATFLIAKMKE